MKALCLLGIGLVMTVPAIAAEDSQPFSCEDSAVHRAFDFWVGDWDVYVDGELRSRSIISRRQNGCLIHENYNSLSGWHGESMNFVDPATGKWRQVWVDQDAGLVTYEGEFRDGAMRMHGRWTFRDGRYELARVSWTELPDGGVEHKLEHSKDEGKSWYLFFLGLYRPHGEGGE